MKMSELIKRVARVSKQVKDSDAMMRELGRLMVHRSVKKQEIRGAGRTYDGVQWDPLATSTVNRKVYVTPPSLGGRKKKKGVGKRRGPKHMLSDTGVMMNALTHESTKTESRIFFMPPESQKYFWHHFGLGYNPTRQILDYTKGDEKAVDRVVKSYVDKALTKAFGN